jgi:hypothetical protein
MSEKLGLSPYERNKAYHTGVRVFKTRFRGEYLNLRDRTGGKVSE